MWSGRGRFRTGTLRREAEATHAMFRNDTQPEPPPRTTTRPLSFSDDKGNEQKWLPGGPRPALDAFREFMDQRRRDGSTSLSIEDEENEEALVLLFDGGAVCRVEFDGSVLRRTHPRDMRHRLEILTRVDGREPATDGEVTHLGFGNGDTVNAWLAADGRALVVTFDRTSALNPLDHAGAHAASLYDGVPADLLALVRDVPETETTLNVPHPDGGTLVAATGVFHFSGPCAMADGLVTRLQEAGSDIEDTGVGRLLDGFLVMTDFALATVAAAAEWWSAEDVARGFAETAASGQEQSVAPPPGPGGGGPLLPDLGRLRVQRPLGCALRPLRQPHL
ncbi:DUF6357 family protein [Streptomyces poriferorum]